MGKQRKQWQTLFSQAPKSLKMVTAAMKLKDTCSLEESYDQHRQHIKSRDITLPTKVHLVKAMIFPVVTFGCESWTIKNAEHWRIDAFELWCWRRLLRVQLSHPYLTTGKTIALTRRTFVGKVMSPLLNVLSRLVITFLPRSKCLLISWLQSPSAVILESPKIKSATVSPSICHEVMGLDAMILVLWMLSFKPVFFTLLFHFHQEAL